ncbi:glycosyltransferase [Vibrio sp. M260112]|uniref:glycosyltransferase n=1 Tax=Vibrio sp. M260112 TaxID=3020895 RepID=UPI002F415EBC
MEIKKLRILFVGPDPRGLGGVQTFGKNLHEIFDGNVDFVSGCFTKPLISSQEYNVIYPLKYNLINRLFSKLSLIVLGRDVLYKYRLNKLLRLEGYQAIVVNSPKYINMFKDFEDIILIQHRTYDSMFESEHYFDSNIELLRKTILSAKKIVLLSKYDKTRFLSIGFNANSLYVIRHCSRIPTLHSNSKDNNKKLIMACRIENSSKRIDLAIKAMVKLSNYSLTIVGDGPDKESLVELVSTLGIKNVFFKDRVTDITSALDSASVHIMTSDFEGYGISNIEAMRRGLPLIVRNTYDAAQDVVRDNGILLSETWCEDEFVQAVKQIENNYSFYSNNSLTMGRRHDFETIKQKWIDLIG